MKSSPLLEANDLVKYYGKNLAVAGVSLTLYPGQCLALLGPNGAGKTTICEMLAGLRSPDAGKIVICGHEYPQERKKILELLGVQLQETHLYKKYTVLETLQLFASFYVDPVPLAKLLRQVNLEDLATRRLEHLSAGQRQTVYIACALINAPRVVFFDEPTAGLDPSARRRVWQLIEELKESKRAILLTTHHIDEAEHLAEHIEFVDRGRIIASGSSESLIRRFCPTRRWSFQLGVSGGEESSRQTHKATLRSLLPWLKDAKESEAGYEIQSEDAAAQIRELTLLAEKHKVPVAALAMRQARLEEVYHKLTGRDFTE